MSGTCAGCGKYGGNGSETVNGKVYAVRLVSLANNGNVNICTYDGKADLECVEKYKAKVQKEIANREAKLKADLEEADRKMKLQQEEEAKDKERRLKIQQEDDYLQVYKHILEPLANSKMALAKLKEMLEGVNSAQ